MQTGTAEFTEAAILGRIIEGVGDQLPPDLAQHILQMSISDSDQQRADTLLDKAAEGTLTEQEREEVETFNHVANLLALWQSKARRSLAHTM